MSPIKNTSQTLPLWGKWLIASVLLAIALAWLHLTKYALLSSLESSLTDLFTLVFLVFGIALYILPWSCASKTPRSAAILVANLAFGWTVIGWFAVLVWALAERGTAQGKSH